MCSAEALYSDLLQRFSANADTNTGDRWSDTGAGADPCRRRWPPRRLQHPGDAGKSRPLPNSPDRSARQPVRRNRGERRLSLPRCLSQLSFRFQHNSTYGQMFTTSLKKYGQLCIGLYRLHDQDNAESVKRYVITNPPAELRIRTSDYVRSMVSSGCVEHRLKQLCLINSYHFWTVFKSRSYTKFEGNR